MMVEPTALSDKDEPQLKQQAVDSETGCAFHAVWNHIAVRCFKMMISPRFGPAKHGAFGMFLVTSSFHVCSVIFSHSKMVRWMFPKNKVPVNHHFFIGFSIIKPPVIGVPP